MKQWRLSWDMWPHDCLRAYRSFKVHDDEEQAMSQLAGLKKMETPHKPRPCSDHVWNILVEVRETGEWQ